jgi:ubiquinone biosynthesis monooxygenase Coq7
MLKHLTTTDKLINVFDDLLRTLTKTDIPCLTNRQNPAQNLTESELTSEEKKQSAALMRVNHAGEIAAQALYKGQALVARDKNIAIRMQYSADEEQDHLLWCRQRVEELNSHTSYLDPVWFLGSLAIGVTAGLAGDRWSLGFIAETEKQVVEHINDHLQLLSTNDQKSRVILEQMREDEQHHGNMAIESGGSVLPIPIKTAMRFPAKIMTTLAYYI